MNKTFVITITDEQESGGGGCVILLGIFACWLIIGVVGMSFLMLLSVGARL